MSELEDKFDELKAGLIYSKSRQAFYNQFIGTLGKYPTLALLSLMSRAQVQINELKMIAYIVEQYYPIHIHNYNLNTQEKPKLCLAGKVKEYIIYFGMQCEFRNPTTNRNLHPDIKVTVVQTHRKEESELFSIAIEYEGHSSHTEPSKVKNAFIRNREITYQIGGPVLPYYKEEVDNQDNRNNLLTCLSNFINQKITRFEDAAVFARKKYNALSQGDSPLVVCPVCEGVEKLGSDFCPACKGVGRIRTIEAKLIDLDNYTNFNCPSCNKQGCIKCNYSGLISRIEAISIALKES
ncbi:hypothetical protein [uncultured Tolumonas sp.]|uniref:hypothetical protein n=1 Tax=uncultured Tolumonas sp. TaxID=263765 RepID=UPI00292F8EDB|nr:hypothetical protein [uncultured Tolumonas sp.]